MKDLDDFITNIVTKEINEPDKYETAIRTALDKKVYKKSKFSKIAVTVCSLLIVITGITYATDIKEFVSKYLYNFNEGVDTAIENGYFDEIEMDYVSSSETKTDINEDVDTSNLEIKVKDMVMDDYTLCFTFSIKFDETTDISNIQRINLNEVLITDENKSVLYCNNKEIFDNYCKNNNLALDYHTTNSGLNWYIIDKDLENKTIDLMFNVISDREKKYPNSQIINIQIGKISMEEQITSTIENIKIEGKWNIIVDVNSKFYDRETINYKVINSNCEDINVTEATLNDTSFTFKFTLPHKPFYLETDSQEIKKKAIDWYNNYYTNENGIVSPAPIINSYVENGAGQKFYQPSNGVEAQYNSDILTSDYIYYKDVFTLTKANQTNTLKVYFTIDLPDIQKDVYIELEKMN